MKNLNRILAIVILSISLFSCGNSKNEAENTEKVENTLSKDANLEKLETESSRLRAGGSIKSVELNDGKAIINYVKNFAEYKELNPQSGLTENDLDAYWESGNAIEKALIDGSVKIMTKLDYINAVKIILPYKSKTYSINVNKNDLEKFTGSNFNKLKG
ncbi:hypothetical protein BWK59_08490, partial [Flavobacterium davisii]